MGAVESRSKTELPLPAGPPTAAVTGAVDEVPKTITNPSSNTFGDHHPSHNVTDPEIHRVMEDVSVTQSTMKENIQKSLQNGQDLEALRNKTETLGQTSTGFTHRSKKIKKQIRWTNAKITCLVVLVVVAVLAVIILSIIIPLYVTVDKPDHEDVDDD